MKSFIILVALAGLFVAGCQAESREGYKDFLINSTKTAEAMGARGFVLLETQDGAVGSTQSFWLKPPIKGRAIILFDFAKPQIVEPYNTTSQPTEPDNATE